jgi:hypothetical protein
MFKINYSINGQKRWVAPDPIWWAQYWKIVAGAVGVVLLASMLFGCSGGSVTPEAVPVAFNCQGTYSGAIVLPNHEERLRAYAESRARGETNEGGGVDHGFYLEGSMSLTVDSACNMSGEFIIHGTVSKASGHVNPDGTFSGGHEGGPFEGGVTGNQITGMIFEGGGREYLQVTQPENLKVPFIFGRLVGEVQ